MTKTKTPDATKNAIIEFNSAKWFWCHCEKCGWQGSSEHCSSHQIADTGDYTDPICPKCDSIDLEGENRELLPNFVGILRIPVSLMEQFTKNQSSVKFLTEYIGRLVKEKEILNRKYQDALDMLKGDA